MGKIERSNGQAYLINNSKNKAYQFTVRVGTTKKGDVEYKTITVVLAPGEQEKIGSFSDDIAIPNEETTIFRVLGEFYRIEDSKVEKFKAELKDVIQVPDTNLNEYGERIPASLNYAIYYTYEITGQLNITASKYLDEQDPIKKAIRRNSNN